MNFDEGMRLMLLLDQVVLFVVVAFVVKHWKGADAGQGNMKEDVLNALRLEEEKTRRELLEALVDAREKINNSNNNARTEILKEQTEGREKLVQLQTESREKLVQLQTDIGDKLIGQARLSYSETRKMLDEKFADILKLTDDKLKEIGNKTEQNIKTNFEQATITFRDILARLGKMDEVQQQMRLLSDNVTGLDKILSNNKTIGTFGEVQLQQVLQTVFGENRKYYDLQYTLKNGSRPDAVIILPEPTGTICVDSKFPLSAYRNYKDKVALDGADGLGVLSGDDLSGGSLSGGGLSGGSLYNDEGLRLLDSDPSLGLGAGSVLEVEAVASSVGGGFDKSPSAKMFKNALTKHIDDVSKYVGVDMDQGKRTGPFAIMFVPSEAIFAEIMANHYDRIEYAAGKNVYISSPTTLMAICSAAQVAVMKIQFGEKAEIIKQHLDGLSSEFDRYTKRWRTLDKQLESVSKTAKNISVTSDKITKRFARIKHDGDVIGAPADLTLLEGRYESSEEWTEGEDDDSVDSVGSDE